MEVLTRVVLICKNKDRKCCSKRDTQARKTKCTTSKVKCNRLMTLGNIWNTFKTTYNKYTSKANSGAKSTSQDTDKLLRQVSDSNTSGTVKIITDIIQKLHKFCCLFLFHCWLIPF